MSRRIGFDAKSPTPRSRARMWDHLLAGEEAIQWEGRPGFGFQFSRSAFKTLAVVAVGLLILGPQILAASRLGSPMGGVMRVPYLGQINGEIFLFLAMGWTVLWFLMQTITTPFFTHYMLSDRRAFIARKHLWTKIKPYELSPLRVVEYDGRRDGSIIFATETRRADNGRKREFPVGFMNINGAEELYEKIVEIQRRNADGNP